MLTDSKTLKKKIQSLGKLEKLLYRLCHIASCGALTFEVSVLGKERKKKKSEKQ